MRITNNIENNSINHSHIQNAIHSLSTKIRNVWQKLCNVFTPESMQHKNEITIAISSPIKLTFSELFVMHENPLYEVVNEPIYEEIPEMKGRPLPPIPSNMVELATHENSLHEEANEPIYEEIPAMKEQPLPLNDEPIYQTPTNNEPIYQTPTNNEPIYQTPTNNEPIYQTPIKNLPRLIADLDSILDNAKNKEKRESTSPLSILKEFELSI